MLPLLSLIKTYLPKSEKGQDLAEYGLLVAVIALIVIALGLAAWWWRGKLTGLSNALKGVGRVAADSFGFEAINRGIEQIQAAMQRGESLGLAEQQPDDGTRHKHTADEALLKGLIEGLTPEAARPEGGEQEP